MRQKRKKVAKALEDMTEEQKMQALANKIGSPGNDTSALDESAYSYYTEKTDAESVPVVG